MNTDLVPQPNPPSSPKVGTSHDEGEASNHSNGAVLVPTAPPISPAAELEILRAQLMDQHNAAIMELERIWAAGAEPGTMTTAVVRLINEAELFSSRLLSAQMNLTLFAARQSKQKK